ncbi:hypothetical protein FNH22_12885 [Fulvivirga sp. M361]|uniref:hypothetical protein n=1 Tax=Fulvivirga sp. M361 TaxID=2594266 RepID=UPI00117B67DF|nr:hypothetical protein [Fulvivirga sp. M361]TRX58766.1 hypothetical protein FNH22_12885 [Fulvivirga sp. M361]
MSSFTPWRAYSDSAMRADLGIGFVIRVYFRGSFRGMIPQCFIIKTIQNKFTKNMRITNAKCSILKENGNALRFAKYAPEGDIRNIHLSP